MAGGDLSKGPADDIVFEDQYHPKAVVDIFGRGGDIISKVNQADEVILEDDGEDEQSSAAGHPQTTNQENLVTNQNILYTDTKSLAMQEDTQFQLGIKNKTSHHQDEEARHDYARRMAASSRLSANHATSK